MARRTTASVFAFLCSLALGSTAFAQATQAAPTQPAPATQAKWVPPIKGTATIEIIRGTPKKVGNDVVTVLKVRNTSKGAIALLTVQEYWYNKQRELVSSDEQRYKKLFNPGEVIEITTKSPWKADIDTNQFVFKHANGKIDPKVVKKFE
jgi:hypothetical protein